MERAECIRMEQKGKFSHVDLMPIQVPKINSYFSKAHNWKCPGNDQIQNYWLKDFPATYSHITRKYHCIIEELEKAPAWLTKGVTFLIT